MRAHLASHVSSFCQATRRFRARKTKSGRPLTPSIKRLSGLKPCCKTVATALARTYTKPQWRAIEAQGLPNHGTNRSKGL